MDPPGEGGEGAEGAEQGAVALRLGRLREGAARVVGLGALAVGMRLATAPRGQRPGGAAPQGLGQELASP